MAGGVQHPRLEVADGEGVALLEEAVELAAVAGELGAGVEGLAEDVLHHGDVGADAGLAAQRLVQVGRGGEVVGVDVGLEDPLHLEAVVADEGDDRVGGAHVGATGGVVEVEHRVEDRAGVAVGILHHVAEGVGGLVEEVGDAGTGLARPGLARLGRG